VRGRALHRFQRDTSCKGWLFRILLNGIKQEWEARSSISRTATGAKPRQYRGDTTAISLLCLLGSNRGHRTRYRRSDELGYKKLNSARPG
jgi:hypothetical protein